jgi:hypothetical protein
MLRGEDIRRCAGEAGVSPTVLGAMVGLKIKATTTSWKIIASIGYGKVGSSHLQKSESLVAIKSRVEPNKPVPQRWTSMI